MALNVVLVEETFYNQLGEFLHINKFASKKQNYKAWILQSVGMSTWNQLHTRSFVYGVTRKGLGQKSQPQKWD